MQAVRSRLGDEENKEEDVTNCKTNSSCVTCNKFQEKEKKLDMITNELEEVREKAASLMAENKKLTESLSEYQSKRSAKKSWIKNPFRNKTHK